MNSCEQHESVGRNSSNGMRLVIFIVIAVGQMYGLGGGYVLKIHAGSVFSGVFCGLKWFFMEEDLFSMDESVFVGDPFFD